MHGGTMEHPWNVSSDPAWAGDDENLLRLLSAELLADLGGARNITSEGVQALLCGKLPFLPTCLEAREGLLDTVSAAVPPLFGTIFLLGLLSNLFVLALMVTSGRACRSTANPLILSLGVADLLFILVCVPATGVTYLAQDRWTLGGAWCKAVQYCIHVAAYVSVYTLVLMSLDRYLAVIHPITSRTIRTVGNAAVAAALTWAVALLVCLPVLRVHGQAGRTSGKCRFLHEDFSFPLAQVVFFATSYFLPLVSMTFLYVRITRRLWSSVAVGGHSSRASLRRRRRITWLAVALVVVFAVCWCPIQVILLLKSLGLFRGDSQGRVVAQIICNCLAYVNSCVNPFLYAFLSEDFKKSLRDAASCRRPGRTLHEQPATVLRSADQSGAVPLCLHRTGAGMSSIGSAMTEVPTNLSTRTM